jgi:HK97 gp10 family phage protein
VSFSIGAKVDVKAVMLVLDRVKQGTRGKVLRKNVGKCSRIVLKASKAKCPVRTDNSGFRKENKTRGLLKKSLGVKVATYSKAVVGIIGPRKGFKAQTGTIKSGPNKGKPIFEDPSNIAHLVEFGTRPHSLQKGDRLARTVAGKEKKGGGKQTAGAQMHPGARPRPFMRPAWDETRSQVRSAMADGIASDIATLAKGGSLGGD